MAGIPSERGKEIRSEDADTSGAQREDVQHKMKQRLYTALMDHKWEEAADFYQDKSVPTKINTAGDTILHLAILTGSDGEVIKLMELMEKQDKRRMEKFVQARNVWGCTPLHQAAFVGMVNVCSFIANHYRTQEVVQPRNKRGETPLHVAVLHGHKEAFLTLQTIIEREGWSALNKKDGGNTILHSAIFREHFDLALIIIKKYPMLVDDEDEEGYSALHILATKLSAFKSGIQLSLLDSFIYHSIHPKDKQLDHPTDKEQKRQDSQDDHKTCDVEGVKQGDQAEQKTTMIQNQGIPPDSPNQQRCLGYFKSFFSIFSQLLDAVVSLLYSIKAVAFLLLSKAPETNDDDDKSKDVRDLEISVEGAKQRDQVDQKNAMMQNKGIPLCLPDKHKSVFNIFSQVRKAIILQLLPKGKVNEIRAMKRKNMDAYQTMQKLVFQTKRWQFESNIIGKTEEENYVGGVKNQTAEQQDSKGEKKPPASPFLMAATRGIIEMVEILDVSPVVALDVDSDGKNIVLLAAEYGQTHVYKHMLRIGKLKLSKMMMDTLFGGVDEEGNSALHMAAKFNKERPWNIPGAALQMQSEIKWYKYVQKSMEPGFFKHYNLKRQTAQEIFTDTHKDLLKKAQKWFISTSQSCSVVAALIAAVAYTSATTVPGGNNQNTGFPMFESQSTFQVFAMSSLIALCFSVAALVSFLSILTSRFHESDFETKLPTQLLGGITALFLSIVANLVSFCAGHFYIIHNKLESSVYFLYGFLSLPVMTFFFMSQLRLYVDLIRAQFSQEPERSGEPHCF